MRADLYNRDLHGFVTGSPEMLEMPVVSQQEPGQALISSNLQITRTTLLGSPDPQYYWGSEDPSNKSVKASNTAAQHHSIHIFLRASFIDTSKFNGRPRPKPQRIHFTVDRVLFRLKMSSNSGPSGPVSKWINKGGANFIQAGFAHSLYADTAPLILPI